MSDLDSATLLRIARRVNAPLMLIVAGSGADGSPQCWKGQLAGPRLWRRLVAAPQELKVFDPPTAWPGSSTILPPRMQ